MENHFPNFNFDIKFCLSSLNYSMDENGDNSKPHLKNFYKKFTNILGCTRIFLLSSILLKIFIFVTFNTNSLNIISGHVSFS